MLLVEAVDEEEAGPLVLLDDVPGQVCAHLDSGDAVQEYDGQVSHAQAAVHLADEIGIAGQVEDVELVLFPVDGHQ